MHTFVVHAHSFSITPHIMYTTSAFLFAAFTDLSYRQQVGVGILYHDFLHTTSRGVPLRLRVASAGVWQNPIATQFWVSCFFLGSLMSAFVRLFTLCAAIVCFNCDLCGVHQASVFSFVHVHPWKENANVLRKKPNHLSLHQMHRCISHCPRYPINPTNGFFGVRRGLSPRSCLGFLRVSCLNSFRNCSSVGAKTRFGVPKHNTLSALATSCVSDETSCDDDVHASLVLSSLVLLCFCTIVFPCEQCCV